MTRRFLSGLAIVGVALLAFAEPALESLNGLTPAVQAPLQTPGWRPLNGRTLMALRVPVVMKDEGVICAAAVLGCGYGAGPMKVALPWDLRRAGAGVALTIGGANISIQRGSFRVSKSMTF